MIMQIAATFGVTVAVLVVLIGLGCLLFVVFGDDAASATGVMKEGE